MVNLNTKKLGFGKLIKLFLLVVVLMHGQNAHAQISGLVFKDYNANALRDSTAKLIEPRYQGLTVTAYNDNGVAIATTTSDANGTYSFTPAQIPAGQKVRLEFTGYPSGTYPTIAGGTSVQFVTAGASAININFAFGSPDDYCQANPLVISTRNSVGPATGTNNGLEGVYYDKPSFTTPGVEIGFSSNAAIGTTYGLAYARRNKTLYASAVVRNYFGTGPGGFDAIYPFTFNDPNDSAAPAPTLTLGTTIDLSTLGVSVGTDPRTGPITGSNPYTDNATLYQKVGKIGIGDIDVDANGDTLYVVNMKDGAPTLAILNVATPSSPSLIADVPMPNPGCTNGVFRPWAIKVYQGKAYIGGVCDASTGTVSDLTAYVYRYDGGTSFTQVASMPMNYTRGKGTFRADGTNTNANWRPWSNTWAPQTLPLGPDIAGQPQPILADIEFTEDGSMILGFADRFTYQTAHGQRQYGVTTGSTFFTNPGAGDIIKFCNIGGSLVLESATGGCLQNNTDNGSITSANKINAPTGVKEFFDDDYYNTGSSGTGQAGHSECALGALALLPGSNQVLTSNYDPTTTIAPGGTSGPVNSSGIRTYNSQSGNYVKGWTTTISTDAGSNRKGGNMGDIEVMCNPAPIEIGNRVWLDSNFNGLQDPNEPGINGVILELVDASGNPVDSDPVTAGIQPTTVTTDANGNWLLTTIVGTDVTGKNFGVNLLPKTNYKVRVATSGTGSDWTSGSSIGAGNLAGLQLTKTNSIGTGAIDISDNDATLGNSPEIAVFIESVGANNHTFDMGFTTLGSIGNYVWKDLNNDGLQNEPVTEGINGEKIYLINASNGNIIDSTITANNPVSGNSGYYSFDSLISGNYKVKFPISVGTSVLTLNGTGVTVDSNSNANSVSGESEIIPINAFGTGVAKNNMTVDAGYAAFGSLGNYVWKDLNVNGLQDEPAAQGINGQKIYLLNGTTNAIIDSTITINNPVTSQPGFYIFDHLPSGDYKVKFPTAVGSTTLTTVGTGATVDSNSNANLTTGESEVITIDAFGTGVAKDNMTVDAGYFGFGSIGNYVWQDINSDGLQNEPTTNGINGVKVYLINATTSTIIDSTLTSNNPISSNPGYYLFDSLASGNYIVQFPTTVGAAVLTIAGTGVTTDSNSNANSVSGQSEMIPIDAYGTGVAKDNMTVDAGYASFGSIGNHIWQDVNGNGLFDEPASAGINGEKVYLLNGITNAILDSVTTANNPATSQPGYYIFDHLVTGDYKVKFPTTVGTNVLTTKGTGVTIDSNSNADLITGISELISIDAFGTGVSRDNMTVDAGYVVLATIGNYVWYDNNKNGIQDSLVNPINGNKIGAELPVPNVTVQLYTAANVLVATDTTDATGKYLFENIPLGNYYVQFVGTSLPNNFVVTNANAGTNDSLDSDVNPTTLQTTVTDLTAGEVDLRWDMGIYIKDTLELIDSCTCHNIEYYTSETKEVLESLSITGTPGSTWILVNQTGMKLIDTIFNPLMPLNTLLEEVTPGNYRLKFANQVGDGFTAKVTNGTDTLSISSVCYGINKGAINIPDTVACSFPTITTLIGTSTYVDNTGTFPATGTALFYILDENDNKVYITSFDKSAFGNIDTAIEIHMEFTPTNPSFCPLMASKIINIKECSQYGSIGNYVWYDLNANGVQDEDSSQGINGLTICLLDGSGNIIDSTITANDSLGHPGYYLFDSLITGNYQVKFPLAAFGNSLTKVIDQGTQLDLNNDADATGKSAIIPIDVTKSGLDKNNPTIDAGYTPLGAIGNYVWYDKNRNGIQDNRTNPFTNAVLGPELPVQGVIAHLYTADNVFYAADTTDATGFYSFNDIPTGFYYVQFIDATLPAKYQVTVKNAGVNDSLDSDVDAITFKTDTTFISANEVDYRWDLGIFKKDTLEIKDPCTCFNIEYKAGETKQAYEVVELKAEPNDTWIIIAQTGMQKIDSLAGANSLISVGDTIKETGPGTGIYDLPFLFPIGGSYSITVTNGYDTLSHANVCYGTNAANLNINDTLICNTPSVTTLIGSATRVDASGTHPAVGTFVYYYVGAANDTNYITQFNKATFGLDTTITLHAEFTPTDAQYCPLAFRKDIKIEACYGSIGNYVWNDDNGNGLLDEPTANGIIGVKVYLKDSTSTIIDSTETANNPITSQPGYYLFDSLKKGNYTVVFPISNNGNPLTTVTSTAAVDSNSDANVTTGESPVVSIDPLLSGIGKDNMTIDAGYVPLGSIGNYVWNDDNGNGLLDEPSANGINGITVYLTDGTSTIIDSVVTANNPITSQPGYYLFDSLKKGNYTVVFPISNNGNALTAVTATAAVDSNSDANVSTGESPVVSLDPKLGGINKDNMTIDAGYVPYGSIGNYVWTDDNADGINNEPATNGISGQTVYLLDGTTNAILDSTTTSVTGYYLFDSLASGDYKVQFPTSVNGSILTIQNPALAVDSNSDADAINGISPMVTIDAKGTGIAKDNMTIDAGYTPLGSIGNYTWYDNNDNGLQDEAAIYGINGLKVYLHKNGTIIDSTTTANDIIGNPGYYLFDSLVAGNYTLEFPMEAFGSDLTTTVNQGATTNGNSDANATTGLSGAVTIVPKDGGLAQNNPTIDAGYVPLGSLGNRVWNDTNKNGLFDEDSSAGINGVTVVLFKNVDGIFISIDSMITKNDSVGKPGYYLFPNLSNGDYQVKFPVTGPGSLVLTTKTPLNQVDENSDADSVTGFSNTITIINKGGGLNQNNPTIDAGYIYQIPFNVVGIILNVVKNSSNNIVEWRLINPKHEDFIFKLSSGQSISNLKVVNTQYAHLDNLYNYIDYNILNGITYYKVDVQSLVNGQVTTSEIASIIRNNKTGITLYPNPTTSIINISFDAKLTKTTFINIYDNLGRLVIKSDVLVGTSNLTVDLSELSSGIYQINIGNESYSIKKD